MFGLSSSSSYAVLALSSLSGAGDSWILARDLAAAIDCALSRDGGLFPNVDTAADKKKRSNTFRLSAAHPAPNYPDRP